MYEDFFGLKSNPFQLSPDPLFLFLTETSREALASVSFGVSRRKGFVLLTGEVGTGKTLVLRCLFQLWEQEGIPCAYFIGPKLSAVDFLAYIAFELGVHPAGSGKGSLLRALYQFFLEQFHKGLTTTLVIDEAHQMPPTVLEEIRVLANFETAQQKLLQIVLVGQPELEKRLDSVELRSLKQRVAVRCHLEPLRDDEVPAYIAHRIRLAGGTQNLMDMFSAEALGAIVLYSKGIPRLVNSICDQALIAAYARRVRVVSAELIGEVVSRFRLDQIPVRARRDTRATPVGPVESTVADFSPFPAAASEAQLIRESRSADLEPAAHATAVSNPEGSSAGGPESLGVHSPREATQAVSLPPEFDELFESLKSEFEIGTEKPKNSLPAATVQEAPPTAAMPAVIVQPHNEKKAIRAWIVGCSLVVCALLFGWMARPHKVGPARSVPVGTPRLEVPSPDTSQSNAARLSPDETRAPAEKSAPENITERSKPPASSESLATNHISTAGMAIASAAPVAVRPATKPSRPSETAPPPLDDRPAGETFPMESALLASPGVPAPPIKPASPSPDFALDRNLKAHSGWVTSIAFSVDGKHFASGSWDQTVKFWDVASGEPVRTLGDKLKEVQALALSRDGHWLAVEDSGDSVTLWDASSGRPIRTLATDKPLETPGNSWVYSIAFSPDGRLLASGLDNKTVRLWDVESGRAIRDLTGLRRSVMYIAFSPDGTLLASGDDDKSIQIWRTSTGEEIRTLTGHKKPIYAVAFSPDGHWLASASADKTVKLWDLSNGTEARTLSGHSSFVTSLAFSPDGHWLASGSRDKTIKIWSVETGDELQTLAGRDSPIYSLSFDPRGQWLASGAEDGTIKLWRLDRIGNQTASQ